MIISQHIGKTAGLSFRDYLLSQYEDCTLCYRCPICNSFCLYKNVKNIQHNCQQSPTQSQLVQHVDEQTQIVHGHLVDTLPQYLERFPLEKHQYITWLRDPYQRSVSHFYFSQRKHFPLKHKDFELFLQTSRTMCDLVKPLSIEQFSFVGIVERYEQSIELFNSIFNLPTKKIFNNNTNPNKIRKGYDINPTWLELVQHYRKDDYDLYERGLKKFNTQLNDY